MDWLIKIRPPATNARADDNQAPAPRLKRLAARTPAAEPQALPRFLMTAADQADPQSSDESAETRSRLSAAYTPSRPVSDWRMFAGRTGVLSTLIRSIEHHRMHAVIFGERGIGKTSLMHVLAHAAREARYLIVYISCGASSNFDDVFRAVVAGVPLLFHRDFGPASAEAERGDTFADLLAPGPVSVHAAGDLLGRISGTRLIVMLDEFDRSESSEFKRNIAELLKNLSDRSVRAQVVIGGVAANLTELIEHIPSIQRNVLALQVPRMTDEEVRSFIGNGEAFSGIRFSEAAVELVVTAAGGMPYLASLLCHHAGLVAIDGGKPAVAAEEVAAAMEVALQELKGRISRRSQLESAILMGRPMRLLVRLSDALGASTSSFTEDDIHAAFPRAQDLMRCRELVEGLAEEGILLTREEDEWGTNYRFVEHSAVAYLRLLYARALALPNRRLAQSKALED
ncbi:MAG: ATP-binding protein [Caulobacteraceae bacterium]|nr:ATP-binding protein [Caulobacteraceae bacterium]